ncbi:MAG: DUF4430 domain-containing protein [Clostridia bacterium]|nr:DUF4430 domain-containing protein [Clostridia bacterium]
MKKTTRNILIITLAVALLAGLLCCWYFLHQKPRQQPKAVDGASVSITVNVTHSDGNTAKFELRTSAALLSDALEMENLIEAHEDTYGLYIDAVDGEEAKMEDSAAWVFDRNGEMCPTGASETLLEDGDVYDFYILTW